MKITDVVSTISDDHSLKIFRTIAAMAAKEKNDQDRNITQGHDYGGSHCSHELKISTIGLSSKQFYSRMSRLIKIGLISRMGRKYSLTSLGKIVYHYTENMLETAIVNHWRLRAIDSIEMSDSHTRLPIDEYNKIVNTIISDEKIKHILNKTVNTLNSNDRERSYSHITLLGPQKEQECMEVQQQRYPTRNQVKL